MIYQADNAICNALVFRLPDVARFLLEAGHSLPKDGPFEEMLECALDIDETIIIETVVNGVIAASSIERAAERILNHNGLSVKALQFAVKLGADLCKYNAEVFTLVRNNP